MVLHIIFPNEPRLPRQEVQVLDDLIKRFLSQYHKHALRKAAAFLKAGRIEQSRYDKLGGLFAFLFEEILLIDGSVERMMDKKIEHAEIFAALCMKYVPDDETLLPLCSVANAS